MTTEDYFKTCRDLKFPPLIELKKPSDCFTHTSYHADRHFNFESIELPEDYERMEHVGDAFLGFIVAELISHLYPLLTVGMATILKSKLVNNRDSLASLSRHYGLPSRLLASKSQRLIFQTTKSIQADIFESYLDALRRELSFDIAREWIRQVFKPLAAYHYLILKKAHYTFHLPCNNSEMLIKIGDKRTSEMAELDENLQGNENKRIQFDSIDEIIPTISYEPLIRKSWICILENWKVHERGSSLKYTFGDPIGSLHTPTYACTCIATRAPLNYIPPTIIKKIESTTTTRINSAVIIPEMKRITMGESVQVEVEKNEASILPIETFPTTQLKSNEKVLIDLNLIELKILELENQIIKSGILSLDQIKQGSIEIETGGMKVDPLVMQESRIQLKETTTPPSTPSPSPSTSSSSSSSSSSSTSSTSSTSSITLNTPIILTHQGIGTTKKLAKNRAAQGICQFLNLS